MEHWEISHINMSPAGNGATIRVGCHKEGKTFSTSKYEDYEKVFKEEEMELAYADIGVLYRKKMEVSRNPSQKKPELPSGFEYKK